MRARNRAETAAVRAAGKAIDEGVEKLRARRRGNRAVGGFPGDVKSLQEVIELERARLTRAMSMLHCLRLTLITAEERNRYEYGCALVADMVFGQVREAVDRLDSIHVNPLIERIRKSS